MSINPISFAQEFNQQFLRYQLTAFPLSDPDLAAQAKTMLSGSLMNESPLVKGPYLSLTRSYKEGDLLEDLANNGIVHPAVAGIADFPRLFAHQQATLDAVKNGMHCLITTGTGSGKTEAFLYPILDHCFRLRDVGAPHGIVAILVYPMNALAIDQLGRLRRMLAGTGITYGMYVGSTPTSEDELVQVERMQEGEGPDRIPFYEEKFRHHRNITIVPFEERLTRKEMVDQPPRILLTNVSQLEYLMTRGKDIGMFKNAPLRFLVFDEAHTYTGTRGAEVSCLIRRIRAFCQKNPDDVICIGTSATITDPVEGELAGKKFSHRFFGIDPNKIGVIQEQFQDEIWPDSYVNPLPVGSGAKTILSEILSAIDGDGDSEQIVKAIEQLSRQVIIKTIDWREAVYEVLKRNKVIKTIYDTLSEPMHIRDVVRNVWISLGRKEDVTEDDEAELLAYLTLAAAAEKEQSPLFRLKLHYFIRGLRGVSVVLLGMEEDQTKVELFFSPEKALEEHKEILPTAVFPVLVCTNCGQHYFETWLSHVDSDGNRLSGGCAEGDNIFWSRIDENEGTRILFTNNFVSEPDEENGEADQHTERLDRRRTITFVCRFCGTLHRTSATSCSNPQCRRNKDLLRVFVLNDLEHVTSCPSCGYRRRGFVGRITEPFRPLSAVTVSDVHIVAQSMLNAQASEQRKLLIFADNRQDAAFQAAWMADHARRYRLRHIMYNLIETSSSPISIGDLQNQVVDFLKEDMELARTIAPEVFAGEIEEAYSQRIDELLTKFIRIAIIREFVTSFRQRDSLETWGMVRVSYHSLDENSEKIHNWSKKYGLSPKEILSGIETIIDVYRRNRHFYDLLAPIFSHYWHPGSEEVQRGFLPYMSFPPKGLKLERSHNDRSNLVTGLVSNRGRTFALDFVSKWGLDAEQAREFLTELWDTLVNIWKVLTPVTLESSRGRPLTGAKGVYQIDSTKIGLKVQRERHRCFICRRIHSRIAPRSVCTAMYCQGTLEREDPPSDDYNISLLEREFTMLIAREHTAQVPARDRQRIEEEFKDPTGGTNCIVATPTLELGVDIGALDMVLMRNVPPLPSNYWQRAGRAGRRHRMAVVYTYCRNNIHDNYFFQDPRRLLHERIDSPKFNLRNPVMIRKHVHATVLSALTSMIQFPTSSELQSESNLELLCSALNVAFPTFISGILFEEEIKYRKKTVDLSSLNESINQFREYLEHLVFDVFVDYWPEEAKNEVQRDLLQDYISETATLLQKHYNQIHQRLLWTIYTRNQILDKEKDIGTLEELDSRLLRRCREYIRNLRRRDLSSYTLKVLANEGFLPGYGGYDGNIVAFAGTAFSSTWRRLTFELNRQPVLAVREFVPGNLIYANAGKYRTALLHLPFGEEHLTLDEYLLDRENNKIIERGVPTSGYSADEHISIEGLPICDVDLAFISHVSDEEQNRFRLSVYIVGYLQPSHRGGKSYSSGNHTFSHILGQEVRLVNVGPADRVARGDVGYPICIVCGAVRSPYASDREIQHFLEHHTKRCGKEPGWFALTADAQVDGILFKGFESQSDAMSLAESLIVGTSVLLEMNREDLQSLVLPQAQDEWDIFLYDPMPGGSGLLDQLLESWQEIITVAQKTLRNCPNACETSCYSCMRTYWNSPMHTYLDRNQAIELLNEFRSKPKFVHDIPPRVREQEPLGTSTNIPEARLRQYLLKVGFPPFDAQETISIPGRIKSTTPDLARIDDVTGVKIAIYLDGLSKGIHGNEERQRVDNLIRTVLRNEGWHVEEISASSLDDPEIMKYHLKSLGHALKRDFHSQEEEDENS